MNIYVHELKMNLRSVITWSVSLILMIFIFTSIYSGFADQAEVLNRTLEQMPPEFLMAFGMDGLDMSTVLGFFSIIFLLLAAITSLAITNLVVWISSFVFINMYRGERTYETKTLVLLLISVTFLQLFFLTVGMLLSLLPKKIRNVTPFSMGMVFGLYLLNAFGGLLGDDKLSVITPFKHFDPNQIIRNGSFDLPLVLISVSLIIISVVGGYLLYARRSIPTAM